MLLVPFVYCIDLFCLFVDLSVYNLCLLFCICYDSDGINNNN